MHQIPIKTVLNGLSYLSFYDQFLILHWSVRVKVWVPSCVSSFNVDISLHFVIAQPLEFHVDETEGSALHFLCGKLQDTVILQSLLEQIYVSVRVEHTKNVLHIPHVDIWIRCSVLI